MFEREINKANANVLELEATVANMPKVLQFIDSNLEAAGCSLKTQMQIDIAVEEWFVNIAHYAYGDSTGMATVLMEVKGDPAAAYIQFVDKGIPYDPLAKADPDVTLSAEERKIGGLGIYLIKNTMDDVIYDYKDGHNMLTIIKTI
jgi:anti-sigma regulatory factor (Ser/Thr protein kinase)